MTAFESSPRDLEATEPIMLNSDDELAKIGTQIVKSADELDDCLQAAVRELGEAGKFGVWPQIGGPLTAALRYLDRASEARRKLLNEVISYSAEAGYAMKL